MLGGDIHGPVSGGIGTVVHTLLGARALRGVDLRYHTTVAADGSRGHKARSMAAGLLRFQARLAAGADLVHIHVADGPSVWRKAIYAAESHAVGLPVCLHGHFTGLVEAAAAQPALAALCRRLFGGAARVFVLSADMQRQVATLSGGRARTEILHNPCPPDGFDPRPRPPEAPPTVLFMGRVGHRKGIFDLVAAWPQVRAAVPAARLLVAGDGELDRLRAAVAAAGVDDAVEILGWVRGEARLAAYRRATVFCLPSYAEGLPMGVLEAMGAGLPVVSTAINGTPDAVQHGETGLLHAPGDRAALAAHLRALLGDPRRAAQMGAAGYARVVTDFDPERQAARLRAVWEAVVAAHPTRRSRR